MRDACMLALLGHSAGCISSMCERAVECNQFKHLLVSHVTNKDEKCSRVACMVCKKMKELINEHTKHCLLDNCPVPTCADHKQRTFSSVSPVTIDSLESDLESSHCVEGPNIKKRTNPEKTTSAAISKTCNGHLVEPPQQRVKKPRAPYKCSACGQIKGISHKCSGSIGIIDGLATVTSFYVYEEGNELVTKDCFQQQTTTVSSESSTSVFTSDLSVSVSESSDEDAEVVTLPSSENCSSAAGTKSFSKDAVAKFNRSVKLKAREESKMMRKLQKSASSKKGRSVNYISDSSASHSFDSLDSFEFSRHRRGSVEHLIAESPMWGNVMERLDLLDACIPCETSIDPLLFSPVLLPAQKSRHPPSSQSVSIFDAKGRVIDRQFDDECKFLQCFDDVDLL